MILLSKAERISDVPLIQRAAHMICVAVAIAYTRNMDVGIRTPYA